MPVTVASTPELAIASLSPAMSLVPTSSRRAYTPGFSNSAITAQATLVEIGLEENVPVCIEYGSICRRRLGFAIAMMSSRPQSTPSGMPPLIAFPSAHKSGVNPVGRLRAAQPHSKARDHFVEYQRDVVVRCDLANPLEKPGLRRKRPLDRLDHDAGGVHRDAGR